MEGGKQSASSSSFTSDLFGSKEPSASSTSGIFASIFAPQPKVLGRGSLRAETSFQNKQEYPKSEYNTKTVPPENFSQTREEGKQSTTGYKEMNSFYQEQKVQPCHLSSSIYYGGQDVYAYPQDSQSTGYTTYNKDGGEDDSGSASRGNWWQGSLYY